MDSECSLKTQQHITSENRIKQIYIFAIILWIILILLLKLYTKSFLGIIVIMIPFFVFIFDYFYTECPNVETETLMLGGNYLTFAFLISSIIIHWVPNVGSRIYPIVSVAIFFMLLSLLDLWVNKRDIIILKHIRTICNTFVLTLFTFVIIYMFKEKQKQL